MSFKGHDLIKLSRDYVFDITEYRGYRIIYGLLGKIKGTSLAFEVYEKDENSVEFKKYEGISVGILKQAMKNMNKHRIKVGEAEYDISRSIERAGDLSEVI